MVGLHLSPSILLKVSAEQDTGEQSFSEQEMVEGLTLDSGQAYTVTVRGAFLRLKLLKDGEPRANEAYTVVASGERIDGTTDGDGCLEERISSKLIEAKLELSDGEEVFYLTLQALDPVSSTLGIQQRLKNMCHYIGPLDGADGPMTQTAVRAFQAKNDLSVDGIAGPQTQGKLSECYGH